MSITANRRWRQLFFTALTALIVGQILPPAAAAPPAKPEGAVIVPEDFLRRWDPVTLFFEAARGPEGGGPEAHPGDYVTVSPDHPGAYTWLDAHTLQFRPAEPWPALSEFTWRFEGNSHRLATLMAPAIRSEPRDGSEDLAPVDTVSLRFRDPVDIDALERMVSVEVRALPGIEPEPLRTLGAEDFTVKRTERADRDAPVDYLLRLHEPIPAGRKALVRLRLSLDDTPEQAMQTIAFSTRQPFRPSSFGCAGEQRAATSAGVNYSDSDPLICTSGNRTIEVAFTAEPESIGPVLGRNLIRFEPAVDNLEYRLAGKQLRITGDFKADTRYRLSLFPRALRDVHGRALEATGVNSLYLAFPARKDFLSVNRGEGRAVMERFGPKMLPLRGRGDTRVDLRIHAIDPLALKFWPYADRPISVDDDAMPPGPGEEPARRTRLRGNDVAAQIRTLGSPSVSEIVDLPLERGGSAARFGLDLQPHLRRLAGEQGPGTYLVGIRRLGAGSERQWVRVQVTDLSLTVVENEDQVRFVVTSLDSGEPVPGARVRVQARDRHGSDRLMTVVDGRTDADGALTWSPRPHRLEGPPERLIVSRGDDTLVVDVDANPPKRYFDNHFSNDGRWLRWTDRTSHREPEPQWRCHLFTERPVYRPAEPIHIKGFMRRVHRGRIENREAAVTLVVTGPDGSEWRYHPDATPAGGFYHLFDEKTEATGEYRIAAELEPPGRHARRCAEVTVRKEAYRIPKFEVRTDAPARTGLDRPFSVDLVAEYYAGGVARQRPVQWKVTQFPYRWTPAAREGFVYSTDARFSGIGEFKSRPTLTREGTTDDQGFASIQIDPALEPSTQPRRYVVEATVVGADDQTVTDTADVLALPPFALGLKAPRYLEDAERLQGAFLVAGPDGDMLAGKEVTLRLVKRSWAARLQASDFTTGEPKYETEIIDETLLERTLTSGKVPVDFDLPLDDTGVYILEISARDALGRLQTVKLDLFNDGSERATWPKAPSETFTVSSTRDSYAPGETATLVLESPFAEAHALAIVERPDGENHYEWVAIDDGKATYELPIERAFMPGIPVHFVLMRGRLDEAPRVDRTGMDLGKPVMMAATTRVDVSTADHRIDVALEHPAKAQPGDTVEMTVTLADRNGDPVSGEVALWLVDQAVLALGKEQPLDPLAAFIRERPVRTAIRDTRNRVIGYLPFRTAPGGGEPDQKAASARKLLDQVSLRKDFRSVPYFEPTLHVGDDGTATVRIELPDNLTNFMVRAKAVGDGERFGHGTSRIAVRRPVIVQPALPRFVRYGDRLTLSAVARVVEGDAGEGRAALEVDGLRLDGEAAKAFTWPETHTRRLDYPVSVPLPEHWPDDPGEVPEARVTLGVNRVADGVGDGFEVSLPVRPDRRALTIRETGELSTAEAFSVEALGAPIRPGSLRRTLVLADRPGLVRMTAGLNYLLAYPHACTEQRISRARGLLAAGELLALVRPDTATTVIDRHVRNTLTYLDEVVREDGYVTFWPGGGEGQVGLTAWTYLFLLEAEKAGYTVDTGLRERVRDALRRALRGDYSHFLDSYAERAMALTALAQGGDLDAGYAAELARRSQFLPQEAVAHVTRALAGEDDPSRAVLHRLEETLWNGLVFKLRHGEKVYAGLKDTQSQRSPLILPSETRTVAQTLRAASAVPDGGEREEILVDALITLGRDDGWGTTNANTEAILALNDFLMAEESATTPVDVSAQWDDTVERIRVGGDQPVTATPLPTPGQVTLNAPALRAKRTVAVMAESRYVPKPRGDRVAVQSHGFVVERGLVRVSGDDTADRRVALDTAGKAVDFAVGDVVEDRLTLVNPAERHHVAVVVPLAAGMEPLNPELETAPPEAAPSRPPTREPAYVARLDDRVAFYYETLPKGTYEFAFRLRAQIPGQFVQPAAYAEMMYQEEVRGHSNGALIRIQRPQER
ncbi:alpha-2-macroglobulin [Arhodomonas sp. AD133]|uniref:alpha-2-macroglobulin family protein n=1 Tax=Arhodomonas sp. AD133 TaxID=3415009 RepID=UPI003EC0EC76